MNPVKKDRVESKNVYVGDHMLCKGCGSMIINVLKGDTWKTITRAYLDHVSECMPLRRLIVKSNMPEPVILKHDIIKCPNCETKQLAQVEDSLPWATFIHHCSACRYVIMESEWDAVVQDVDTVTEEGRAIIKAHIEPYAQ